jgi:hypothetical protein
MILILKQILIITISFLIVYWFQYKDDLKVKRKRITMYEKFKFPLLIATIVGLVLNLHEFMNKDCKITSVVVSPIIERKTESSHFSDINQLIYTDMPDF